MEELGKKKRKGRKGGKEKEKDKKAQHDISGSRFVSASSRIHSFKSLRINRQTNGLTDGPTDNVTFRVVSSRIASLQQQRSKILLEVKSDLCLFPSKIYS